MNKNKALLHACLAWMCIQEAASTVLSKYIKAQCDASTIFTNGMPIATAGSLTECAALWSKSHCAAFAYSENGCSCLNTFNLTCPMPWTASSNDQPVYVQTSSLPIPQDCPLDYPYAINNGTTCCSNYIKVNNNALNVLCNGLITDIKDPDVCCNHSLPCPTVRCDTNSRFSSGCFLTGYDSTASSQTDIPNTANASVCYTACQGTSSCTAFTYLSPNYSLPYYRKICYLKNGVNIKYGVPTIIAGPPSCNGIGCMMTDTDFATYISVAPPSTTEDEYFCQMNCQSNTDCTHFTYVTGNSSCFLRKNVGTISDATGFISGPSICV